MNVLAFKEKKQRKEKIVMVTCYDYTSARILEETDIDTILVGDSLAMTMYGEKTTLPATVELMAQHTVAVSRGAPGKFIVGDLPFLSYRGDLKSNVAAVAALMRAGAHAVKLEGVSGNEELIQHLVESGVPVMGHLGLTPQSIHQLGGFKVQGRAREQAQLILDGALELERRGCFAIVLECVPSSLAREISLQLAIPTIGIGAGPDTDGQVLVWQDLLGLNEDFKPKFVRRYLNGAEAFRTALNQYAHDVRDSKFPSPQEGYE
jgi:3-methyl-2-oxobutanoate hydroxymethyltransferase